MSKKQVENKAGADEIKEEPAPASPKPKQWKITLTEAASYTAPNRKRKILRGSSFVTGSEAVAQEFKSNGYFEVLEV